MGAGAAELHLGHHLLCTTAPTAFICSEAHPRSGKESRTFGKIPFHVKLNKSWSPDWEP